MDWSVNCAAWQEHQNAALQYAKNDSWDRLYHQGIRLLERFAQDDRVQIRCPKKNLQVKCTRRLACGSEFLSYVDAIGELDGTKCILDWKTTGFRYPEQPEGLLSLDPQLICYSWMTGIADVSLVVFVRKSAPEIQYLKTLGSMSDFQPRRPRLRLDPDSYRKLRTEVLERDGWRCQYCGSSDRLQVHHMCSRSLLGDDTDENLITLCADCHSDIETASSGGER